MEPLGSVLIVHGLYEHSGRYEHVGERLASEGFEVHAFDLRGHGATSGPRGHVGAFAEYYGDVGDRLSAIRASAAGRPLILYGHSLGGLIALGYVLRTAGGAGTDGPPLPDLLVLSAPSLDSTIPMWKQQLARIAGRLRPTMFIKGPIAGELRSSDPSVGERFDADPLCQHGATAGFGLTTLAEQRWVRSAQDLLAASSIPTLVIHGEDDRLVPPEASARLGELANVTRRTFPGIRHELHNEPSGPTIVGEVVTWIREQVLAAAR